MGIQEIKRSLKERNPAVLEVADSEKLIIQTFLNEKIRNKPELRGVSPKVVESISKKYLRKSPDIKEKQLIKQVRAELRALVGQYQLSPKKRAELIKNKDWNELLNTHLSTKERIQSGGYPLINKIILSNKTGSILDLGCGLNPLVLANPSLNYTAIDIKQDELEIIQEFFLQKKIKGEIIAKDIREKPFDFPKADLCLILKLLDLIESKGHKLAEEIILSLKSKRILISFSTKKISGRFMNRPRRIWLEQLLTRLNFQFKIFFTDNEIFYSI